MPHAYTEEQLVEQPAIRCPANNHSRFADFTFPTNDRDIPSVKP
jgi:hypothetical protein